MKLTKGLSLSNLFRIGASVVVLGAAMSACPRVSLAQDQDTPKKEDGKKDKKETPPPYTGPKKRLAVMNQDLPGNATPNGEFDKYIKAHYNLKDGDDVGLKLNTMLTTALQNTGRFVLVERQNFNDIRGEQDLAKEGQTTVQTGAKKGGILGAQIMVRCVVTQFEDTATKEGGGASIGIGSVRIGGGGSKKRSKVVIDIKMYDVATSKILQTSSATGTSESKGAGIGVSALGSGGVFGKSSNDPIEKATRDAIINAVNFIVEKMDAVPWEGKVALADKDDDGKPLYVINRGEADGLKIGDQLLVTSPGKAIVDPDTGETLGRSKDKVLGACRVVWTDKNIAHVEPDSGVTIVQGAIVKFK